MKRQGKRECRSSWAEEHSQALREYLERGLSFSEVAKAINARFNTAYSRNATIGRARRMGLSGPERPDRPAGPKSRPQPSPARLKKMRAGLSAGTPAEGSRFRTGRGAETSLRRRRAAPSFAARARSRRLPLPLWRRCGGRSHHLLRPPPPRGFELLRLAFSPDKRPGHLARTLRRQGRCCGLWRRHEHDGLPSRSPDEAAFAAASPGASARADPARAGRLDPPRRTCCAVARSVGGHARKRKPQPVNRAP